MPTFSAASRTSCIAAGLAVEVRTMVHRTDCESIGLQLLRSESFLVDRSLKCRKHSVSTSIVRWEAPFRARIWLSMVRSWKRWAGGKIKLRTNSLFFKLLQLRLSGLQLWEVPPLAIKIFLRNYFAAIVQSLCEMVTMAVNWAILISFHTSWMHSWKCSFATLNKITAISMYSTPEALSHL